MKDTANLYKTYMLKNEQDNLEYERKKSYELAQQLEKLKLKEISVKVSI